MSVSLSRPTTSAITLSAGLAMGLAAGIAVAAARDSSMKYYLPPLGALAFAFVLVVAGRYAERVCLWTFLVTIPLPMHVFFKELEPIHGGGAIGIYALAPDFCLVLLYAFWIASKVGEPRPLSHSWRMVLVFLPFLLFGAFSLEYGVERFWAFCEWLRWFKVLLILLYATRRLKRSEVESCLWALALSASVQGGVGILQFCMKSNLGLEKLGLFGSGARYDATQEILGGVSMFRGSGLTSHPNLLASYLVLLLPLLLLRAITATGKLKILWYAALAISAGGLFSTMSRAAWAAFLGTAALAYVVAIGYKLLTLRRAFQLSLGLFAVVLVLVLSFFDTIRGRFEVDFSQSWKLRSNLSETALEIARDHPILGVGLNSYTLVYPQYDPNYAAELMETDGMITVVHNVFLLVLAETGIVGLTAFLLFYGALFEFGLSGLRARSGRTRATIIGLLAGILGAMLFDLTELALWAEISMYTVAFLAGIIDCLNPSRPAGRFAGFEPSVITASDAAPQEA